MPPARLQDKKPAGRKHLLVAQITKARPNSSHCSNCHGFCTVRTLSIVHAILWEGRYKSQALLTEEALLSCMAYVDLNPIRAGMAATPEDSQRTSIRERIRSSFNLGEAVREQIGLQALIKFELPVVPLATFDGTVKEEEQDGILFGLTDYIELVDITGRILRENKRGAIPNHLPPILQRLEIDELTWLENAAEFEKHCSGRFARPRRKTLAAA